MSRSRKKNPFKQLATDKGIKKSYNRKIRRTREDVGQNMEYKKHHNSYDICDFLLYAPDDPKIYRK